LSECDKQSKVLDYRNGKLYAHVFNGNGVIESEDTKFTIKEPVQDSVVIKDGFLVVCMRDAKSVPALYSKDSKILMEFPLDSPRGLVSMDSDRDIALLVMSGFGIPYEIYRYKDEKLEKSNPILYQGTIQRKIFFPWKVIKFIISFSKPVRKHTIQTYTVMAGSIFQVSHPIIALLPIFRSWCQCGDL
jgi:hypothetical protein